jgi:CubicO group peptidase (beta-lactamase class C family)
MTDDQTASMSSLPDIYKQTESWGLGFMIGAAYFGDLVSRETYGHIGATGTIYWTDPTTELSCVLLTNQPRLVQEIQENLLLQRYSNMIAGAVIANAMSEIHPP